MGPKSSSQDVEVIRAEKAGTRHATPRNTADLQDQQEEVREDVMLSVICVVSLGPVVKLFVPIQSRNYRCAAGSLQISCCHGWSMPRTTEEDQMMRWDITVI